jgi:hypothetical protein
MKVKLPGQSDWRNVDSPIHAHMLLSDAWRMQESVSGKKWSGIKLTIYPDGKSETVFFVDSEQAGP